MNEFHFQFLASPEWAAMLEADLLPWISGVDLGDDVLEVGPGPGLTTDLLRKRTPRLTCVEVDEALAEGLTKRLLGTNVEVIHADAVNSGLDQGRFSAATCFGMLHHLPTPDHQDQLFREIYRMLRPAALFLGTDGLDDDRTRQAHLDDVFVPIDPFGLANRLEETGFVDVRVDVRQFDFRFRAKKRSSKARTSSPLGFE
jgi:SAM-dependent methyltransferase